MITKALTLARTLPLLFLGVALSGCIAIDSQSRTQRLHGYVTLSLTVCVSDHNQDTYATCDPDTRTQPTGTAEGDNGDDGDEQGSGRGQLLVGYRVPNGTVAPTTFQSTDASVSLTRNQGYTNELTAEFRPAAGFHWEGYLSTDLPFDPTRPADRLTTISPEFVLPPGANGAPFVGPFRWRAVIGFRATRVDTIGDVLSPTSAVDCDNFFHTCFDSPSIGVATPIDSPVSDIGIHAGSAVAVAGGETASVTFPIQNFDPAGAPLANRTVSLAASTTIPGATAQTEAPSLLLPASPSVTPTQSTTVTVAVPPNTPVGTYTTTLTARANNAPGPEVVRTNTATITVLDKAAPGIRISTPTEGATFTVGQAVIADYGCTDEAGGSGLSTCSGPVPSGLALDTSSPGAKTFTVNASDGAGNASSATRSYTVVTPAPTVIPASPAGRINVSLAFDFRAAKSTRFTLLQVKNVPAGSTVEAKCKGKGCPKVRVKGKRRMLVFTKNKASGTISLKPFLKKSLRAGTVLTVTVTKPGSFGMAKKLKVRAFKRPTTTTTCLQPGSKTAKAPCST